MSSAEEDALEAGGDEESEESSEDEAIKYVREKEGRKAKKAVFYMQDICLESFLFCKNISKVMNVR